MIRLIILSYVSFSYLDLSNCVFQSMRLSRLDASNMPMVDYPALSLSKALLTSRLTTLHLHNAQLSGMPLYRLGMMHTHTHTHGFKAVHVCMCLCVSGGDCVCPAASRTRFDL